MTLWPGVALLENIYLIRCAWFQKQIFDTKYRKNDTGTHITVDKDDTMGPIWIRTQRLLDSNWNSPMNSNRAVFFQTQAFYEKFDFQATLFALRDFSSDLQCKDSIAWFTTVPLLKDLSDQVWIKYQCL